MRQQIIRNTKFWFLQAQKIIAIMAVFGFGYTVLFSQIANHSSNDMNYMQMVALVFVAIMPISYLSSYIPMIIGFGATRREAAWGFQIMMLLSIIETIFITYIHSLIFPNIEGLFGKASVLGLFIAMICTASISQTVSAYTLRHGKAGMIVGTVIFLIIIMAVGILAAFFQDVILTKLIINKNTITCLGLGVGAILYVISIISILHEIKKFEVQHG